MGATVYSASNPANSITDRDVSNILRAGMADGTLPSLDADNQNLYLVIMPQGVNNQNSGFIGEHTYYVDPAGKHVHFGWITNGGTLNGVTSILSHELVESVNDSEGSAIMGVVG